MLTIIEPDQKERDCVKLAEERWEQLKSKKPVHNRLDQ